MAKKETTKAPEKEIIENVEAAEAAETALAVSPAEPVAEEDPVDHSWDPVELTTNYPNPGEEDEGIPIIINGRRFLLPRGKTFMCPYCVAEEYKRSLRARMVCIETMEARRMEAERYNAVQSAMITGGLPGVAAPGTIALPGSSI